MLYHTDNLQLTSETLAIDKYANGGGSTMVCYKDRGEPINKSY